MQTRTTLEQLQKLTVLDESGEERIIGCMSPVSQQQLDDFEKRWAIGLPLDLRELLQCSNGLDFFGCRIMPLEEMMVFDGHGLITFHNWGNGDFDCLTIGRKADAHSQVVFINHTPDVAVPLHCDLPAWLRLAADEFRSSGTLAHPGDYRLRGGTGLYRIVYDSLRGVDCELNR